MEALSPAQSVTMLRILATTDLAAALVPVPTSYGEGGTCAGVAELLEVERDRQATVWLHAGDLTVGPAYPLLGTRPWADLAELPITAAAAGNHEFDDGVPALLEAARSLPFPLLCANVDVGLPASTLVDMDVGPLWGDRADPPPRPSAEQCPAPSRRLARTRGTTGPGAPLAGCPVGGGDPA